MIRLIVALMLSVPALALPSWWVALHGAYLSADELASSCPAGYTCVPMAGGLTAQIPEPVTQAVAPVLAAVTSASSISYLPKWYGSVGGGATIPGKGRFAYESISAYLGAQTYATTAQEFTFSKGTVQTCTMAGLSKVLYQFGFMSLGMTGLGGGCNSTVGSSGGAAAAQGFASFHIGQSGVSIVATGDKTFTTTGNQAVKLTIGVSYGR